MTDQHPILHLALSRGLLSYLCAQPLYSLCREQVADACRLIDQCCLRIHGDDINKDLASMCIQTTIHEETIFNMPPLIPRHASRIGSACTAIATRRQSAMLILHTSWLVP